MAAKEGAHRVTGAVAECNAIAASEAGQKAASDYVLIFFRNRLHLVGRPQMSTRASAPELYRKRRFGAMLRSRVDRDSFRPTADD